MKVLITVPMNNRVPILADWLKTVLDWVFESKHQVRLWPETTPNRMDWSISACIQKAKDENPDLWIRIDADTVPENPLDDCIEVTFENKKTGFDVTAVATVMHDGVIQAYFMPPYDDPPRGEPVPDGPMEVYWVSGSLVFTPKHVFAKMTPVGEYVYRNGETKNFYIQPQHPKATEDVDFCERVRALGFRVCADTRIGVGQDRPRTKIPSLRAPMRFGMSASIQLQGVTP